MFKEEYLTKRGALRNRAKIDFSGFWDLWDKVYEFAVSIVEPDSKGDKWLSGPNKMMVAAYAAGLWFASKIEDETWHWVGILEGGHSDLLRRIDALEKEVVKLRGAGGNKGKTAI